MWGGGEEEIKRVGGGREKEDERTANLVRCAACLKKVATMDNWWES